MPVVGNDDDGAGKINEKILEPVHRIDVEVVGRLVEQHDFRLAEERLRQQHLDLFAALQGVHLGVMQLGRDSEALKDCLLYTSCTGGIHYPKRKRRRDLRPDTQSLRRQSF